MGPDFVSRKSYPFKVPNEVLVEGRIIDGQLQCDPSATYHAERKCSSMTKAIVLTLLAISDDENEFLKVAKLESVEACRAILKESYGRLNPERKAEGIDKIARSLPSIVDAVIRARMRTDEGLEDAIAMTKGRKIEAVVQSKSEEEGSILQRIKMTINFKNLIGMTRSRIRSERSTIDPQKNDINPRLAISCARVRKWEEENLKLSESKPDGRISKDQKAAVPFPAWRSP